MPSEDEQRIHWLNTVIKAVKVKLISLKHNENS